MSKFIGRRIVPKHDGVWDIGKEYEELSIVLDKASGESYISRKPVPVGTAITDETYWMQYSLYSAQIAEAVKEMETTEARLTQYVDTAESNMNNRVNSAESLTNSNKAELNSRMDTLDKRLDANVSASTDKDKDYAAEVVDARVHKDGTTYASAGKHLRALDSGDAIERVDAHKVIHTAPAMKDFYELLKQKTSLTAFDYAYDSKSDTLELSCVKDYSGDFILYLPFWNPRELAYMLKTNGKLLLKFQTKDVQNTHGAFKMGFWMGRTETPDSNTAAKIFGSTFVHTFKSGENSFELSASFQRADLEYDDDLECFVKDGKPVNLQFLLYANAAKAGDRITVCGNGGIVAGVAYNGTVTAYKSAILHEAVKQLTDRVRADEVQDAKNAAKLDAVVASSLLGYRVLDFAPTSIFAIGESKAEKVEDEYGDESYQMSYVTNNPMYQMNLTDYLLDDNREVIIDITARSLSEGSKLRVQLYDDRNGMSHQRVSYVKDITSDYRRYQFKTDRRNSGRTILGIGPNKEENTAVQFKDVKVLIPNGETKDIPLPQKYFCGYLGSVDFAQKKEVLLDNPLILGTDDYAKTDGLYLESIDLYSTKQRWVTFYVGCIDQYGLFQKVSEFNAGVRKGDNHLKFDDMKIAVPAGNGIFAVWHNEMAVYEKVGNFGFHDLVSTKGNYFQNAEGYSGYPLMESRYMVPMRYTLIEENLPVKLSKMQKSLSDMELETDDLSSRVGELEADAGLSQKICLISPDGIKYTPTVSSDGKLSMIRSIPQRVVVFGNSLTTGFGGFGMAARDNQHDYFYYVCQFLLEKNPLLKMTRHGASGWEGKTDSESRKQYVEELMKNGIDGTEDLILIQLSDNVNTAEKKATFPEDVLTMTSQFRRTCPKARIMWIAAWYGAAANYPHIKAACEKLGVDLIDIRDLSGIKANQSAIGNTYTKEDGSVATITSSGVASHPGDVGMKKIADRIIARLESYM